MLPKYSALVGLYRGISSSTNLVKAILAAGVVVADVMFIFCYGTMCDGLQENSSLENTLGYQLKVFRLLYGNSHDLCVE